MPRIMHNGQHEITIPAVMGTRVNRDEKSSGFMQPEPYEVEPARKEIIPLSADHGFGGSHDTALRIGIPYVVGVDCSEDVAADLVANRGFRHLCDEAGCLNFHVQGMVDGKPVVATDLRTGQQIRRCKDHPLQGEIVEHAGPVGFIEPSDGQPKTCVMGFSGGGGDGATTTTLETPAEEEPQGRRRNR